MDEVRKTMNKNLKLLLPMALNDNLYAKKAFPNKKSFCKLS